MTKPYQLLVFDWDGTLMDSVARIVACIQAAILDLELDPRTDNQVRNIIGLGLHEAITTLYPGSDEVFAQRMSERYRHHFLSADPTPMTLFPGSYEVITRLYEEGYWLAVATGKGRHGLDLVLEETGLGDFFHATRCADETFSKPHPQMLQEIMDVLGIESVDTLMIGDSEYDLQMAANAKTHSLGVSYGVHSVDRLLEHNPLACLDAITELPTWLESRSRARAVNE